MMKNPLENELSDDLLEGASGGTDTATQHCGACGGTDFCYIGDGYLRCLNCGKKCMECLPSPSER